MKVKYSHIKIKDGKITVMAIDGILHEFGARICKVQLLTPYGNYKVNSIVGVKTNKLKFIE